MFHAEGFSAPPRCSAGASAVRRTRQAASIPEAPTTATNTMQPPLFPSSGPDYQPVVTLNGWTLPVADERRLEGIPSGRRTCAARIAPA